MLVKNGLTLYAFSFVSLTSCLGELSIAADAQLSIPNSLTNLLTSKVDKLTPSQQVAVKVASVIGLVRSARGKKSFSLFLAF